MLSREQPAAAGARVSAPATKGISGSLIGRLSLDSIGQRDETLRQRVGGLLERLDDIKSIHDEFGGIVEPLIGISDELTRASKRTIELESNLLQERQILADVRQEAQEAVRKASEMSALLSDSTAGLATAEAQLKEALEALDEQRTAVRDITATAENLERQLFVETEQRVALSNENKALRIEAQNADIALSQVEHEARGFRERVETVAEENRRLHQLSEEQAIQLAAATTRLDEVESQWETDRERMRRAQADLSSERADRERLQAQYENESSNHRSERAGIAAKVEATNMRVASMEQALSQAHRQLREKDESVRSNDRTLKEAAIARTTAERRLEALLADAERQRERVVDMQHQRAEAIARADMLAKALAAKDLTIDQVNARNSQLADRIEQLNAKYEGSRAEFETANRRLVEDLENERSERLLAQGALDIARESRATLQKQHDALKRAGRTWRDVEEDDRSESNVKPFRAVPTPRQEE